MPEQPRDNGSPTEHANTPADAARPGPYVPPPEELLAPTLPAPAPDLAQSPSERRTVIHPA